MINLVNAKLNKLQLIYGQFNIYQLFTNELERIIKTSFHLVNYFTMFLEYNICFRVKMHVAGVSFFHVHVTGITYAIVHSYPLILRFCF